MFIKIALQNRPMKKFIVFTLPKACIWLSSLNLHFKVKFRLEFELKTFNIEPNAQIALVNEWNG